MTGNLFHKRRAQTLRRWAETTQPGHDRPLTRDTQFGH